MWRLSTRVGVSPGYAYQLGDSSSGFTIWGRNLRGLISRRLSPPFAFHHIVIYKAECLYVCSWVSEWMWLFVTDKLGCLTDYLYMWYILLMHWAWCPECFMAHNSFTLTVCWVFYERFESKNLKLVHVPSDMP